MIGIVLVTHGRLAEELILAMEHVVGKQEKFAAVCIFPADDMEERREEIKRKVEEVNGQSGVILLTDMFGGTPSNLTISIMENYKAEVIAGVNLPILIKLSQVRRDMPLKQACAEAIEAGRKYISAASQLLSQEG